MAVIIQLSPVRDDRVLELSCAGAVLVLNGLAVDLSAEIEAAARAWIPGAVEADGEDLRVTVLFPIAADAPEAARFPAPIRVESDGPVALPPRAGPAA